MVSVTEYIWFFEPRWRTNYRPVATRGSRVKPDHNPPNVPGIIDAHIADTDETHLATSEKASMTRTTAPRPVDVETIFPEVVP